MIPIESDKLADYNTFLKQQKELASKELADVFDSIGFQLDSFQRLKLNMAVEHIIAAAMSQMILAQIDVMLSQE